MSRIKTNELLELILNNQWADVHDIEKIACVGKNRTQRIKKDIVDKLKEKGKILPYSYIPMEKVIEYLDININYLKRIQSLNE